MLMMSVRRKISATKYTEYTCELDIPYSSSRNLIFGPRNLSVAGLLAWKGLAPEIKTSLTLGQFSSQLKTEMFLRSNCMSVQPS